MESEFNFLEKELIDDAERILDNMGLNLKTVIRMLLKRIVNENSIYFLVQNNINVNMTEQESTKDVFKREVGKMTKNRAVALFKSIGENISGNITFASKNKSGNFYWANPSVDVIKDDWYLILNDWIERKIHLFVIPKGEIKANELVPRSDMGDKIDLQIMYADKSFTDSKSKFSFLSFLKERIEY